MDDDHIDAWKELGKILIGLAGIGGLIWLFIALGGCWKPVFRVTVYEVHRCGQQADSDTILETGNDGNSETKEHLGLDSSGPDNHRVLIGVD